MILFGFAGAVAAEIRRGNAFFGMLLGVLLGPIGIVLIFFISSEINKLKVRIDALVADRLSEDN